MKHASLPTPSRAAPHAGKLRHVVLRAMTPAIACVLAACASDDAEPYEPAAIQTPAAAGGPGAVSMPSPMPAPPNTAIVTPLDYYQWARAAAPEELRAERLRLNARGALARQFPSETGGVEPLIDAVHLAIVLGESALASRESEREAMALLATIDAAGVGAEGQDYAIFAEFLLNHLRQREELRTATSNVVASREELEMLERDRAQLQEKIDALTRIEEQLIEREQAQGDQ